MNLAQAPAPPVDDPLPTTVRDPGRNQVLAAFVIALALVSATRWPVARSVPVESDEFGFVQLVNAHWFPMHHTLFLTGGRLFGLIAGDAYRGFVWLDMFMSTLALVATWWWLRALVPPATAAAGAALLAFAPLFWAYGAIAGNYTGIIAAGSFLLGVAWRTRSDPRPWHPYAAAAVLALGTGYRQDIGALWLPLLAAILWCHRWRRATRALALFTFLNLLWLGAMFIDNQGWSPYRTQTGEFAHEAGYLNSIWNLGIVDAPVRYGVKMTMALLWTLGPCLLFVPRGAARMLRVGGKAYFLLLLLPVVPALGLHLFIHFGVPGYSFHYVPALLALAVVGIGARQPAPAVIGGLPAGRLDLGGRWASPRLAAAATLLAALFLAYPTDYQRPGIRGSFDLAFLRYTRVGLKTPMPHRQPAYWRTANSRVKVSETEATPARGDRTTRL